MCLGTKPPYQDDLRFVVEELERLVEDDELRPLFKVLITTPGESRYLRDVIGHERRVLLVDGLGNDNISGQLLQNGDHRLASKRSRGRRELEDIAENFA